MKQIIISEEKIRFYHCLEEMCQYVQYTPEWRDAFWEELLKNPPIYQEFLYYLEHQDFLGEYQVDGYSVLDIFVWIMRRYNIRTDKGRNGTECDKTALLLDTFRMMLDMKENGTAIEWAMEMKNGMDEL